MKLLGDDVLVEVMHVLLSSKADRAPLSQHANDLGSVITSVCWPDCVSHSSCSQDIFLDYNRYI